MYSMGDCIATKKWYKSDIVLELRNRGYAGTEEEVEAVCASDQIKYLELKTNEEWSVIGDAIYELESEGKIGNNRAAAELGKLGFRLAECRDCMNCHTDERFCSYWGAHVDIHERCLDCGHEDCGYDLCWVVYDKGGDDEYELDEFPLVVVNNLMECGPGEKVILALADTVDSAQDCLNDIMESMGDRYDENNWTVIYD